MKNKKVRNTLVVIDGENISSKNYFRIMREAKKIGKIATAKAYGLQKDPSTKGWSDESKKDFQLKDIRLYGEPSQNKVDKKIKQDVRIIRVLKMLLLFLLMMIIKT